MGSFGPPEFLIILLILVLLFGAKKLPELARGSGRALRIFKSETKGLKDDDDKADTGDTSRPATPEHREIQAPNQTADSDQVVRERRDDTTA